MPINWLRRAIFWISPPPPAACDLWAERQVEESRVAITAFVEATRERAGYFVRGPSGSVILFDKSQISTVIAALCAATGDSPDCYEAASLHKGQLMGALAAKRDLSVQAGATWTERITYRDTASNSPINITGYSARMQLRSATDASVVDLEINTGNSRLIITGGSGLIELRVAAADTTPLAKDNKSTKYVYGLELYRTVSGVEEVISLLYGDITVLPEVVRA